MKQIKECEGYCPKCKSNNINYEKAEFIDDTHLIYNCSCNKCGCFFTETYKAEYIESCEK